MIEKGYYIGMDVHKEFVQMAVFEEKGEYPIYERRLNNDTALPVKEVARFSRQGKTEFAYEAGSLRYVIQRAMEKTGISCFVLPTNKAAKKRTERIKTDKRYARPIGRELRSHTIRPIAVPDAADEAARDLPRRREDASEDLRRVKQRLLKFSVRHGHIHEREAGHWTMKHRQWMDKIEFGRLHAINNPEIYHCLQPWQATGY